MRRYTDTVQITGIATAGRSIAAGANSSETANKHDGGGMKEKLVLLVAKVLWWFVTGKWVTLAAFKVQEVDPLLRPIDQTIKQIFDLLDKWEKPQRKEIICAVINRECPGKHIHANPTKRKAA